MSMIRLPEAKRYPPAGYCIYCKRTPPEVTLSLEHIIPLAINGHLLLPAASCEICAKIINEQFERGFLRDSVIDVRAHLKMRSRSKRRNKELPPSERPGRIARFSDTGAFLEWEQISREDHPFAYVGVTLEAPTILMNKPAKNHITVYGGELYFDKTYYEKTMKIKGRSGLVQNFSPDQLCREIAKIAHGAAIAELGTTFEPFLPPIILGQSSEIFHLVGGAINTEKPTAETHSLSLTVMGGFWVAIVRLFAVLGAPALMAVVGRKR